MFGPKQGNIHLKRQLVYFSMMVKQNDIIYYDYGICDNISMANPRLKGLFKG